MLLIFLYVKRLLLPYQSVIITALEYLYDNFNIQIISGLVSDDCCYIWVLFTLRCYEIVDHILCTLNTMICRLQILLWSYTLCWFFCWFIWSKINQMNFIFQGLPYFIWEIILISVCFSETANCSASVPYVQHASICWRLKEKFTFPFNNFATISWDTHVLLRDKPKMRTVWIYTQN
jgi:hypothetical protein